ncbi:MAG: pentapeptide repeat-containing protein [Methanomicrobiales archaeon]
MKCKYGGCEEEVFEDLDVCVLHMELPRDEMSDEFKKINDLKNKKMQDRIKNDDINFKGVKIYQADFKGMKTEKDLVLTDSIIKKDLNCDNSEINGDLWADNIKIDENISFEFSTVSGSVSFFKAKVKGNVFFDNSKIGEYAWFQEAEINGESSFNNTNIGGSVSFKDAIINENVSFYGAKIGGNAWFDNAVIGGKTWFDLSRIEGGLSFIKTKFKDLKGQERACRVAKIIWEKLGDREKADYHFYHEMAAKRRQKQFYIKYPELIVQYPFGYGVRPSRLLFSFISIFLLFALLYWYLEGIFSVNSLLETLRFSFLTMIIPAYGVIKSQSGVFGIISILEAVIGAFTWPTFIVTFARKYMR